MSILVARKPLINEQRTIYSISAFWDNDAQVWIATSNDVFGLVLESKTYDELMYEAEMAIPTLLEYQDVYCGNFSLSVTIKPIEELIANG